jgi:hypothetical protein
MTGFTGSRYLKNTQMPVIFDAGFGLMNKTEAS